MKAKRLILLIFLLALVVRVYPLHQHTGWDESAYIQDANVILGEKYNYSELNIRPPLFPLMVAGSFMLWNHVYSAQLLVNVLSSLVIFALFLIGKKLHGEKAGLFAALIAAVHPLFVESGHYILNDGLLTTALAFALYLSLGDGLDNALFAGVLGGMAILFKFTSAAPSAILGAYWLYKKWPDFNAPLYYAAGLVLPLVPYFIWVKVKFGSYLHTVNTAMGLVVRPSDPWAFQVFTVPIVLGILIYAWKEKWDENLSLALAWLLSLLIPLSAMHVEARFLLSALVPLAVLAGIGFSKVASEKWHVAAIIVLIIASSAGSFYKFMTPSGHEHLQQNARTAQFIESQNDTAPIYATAWYPVYARFTDNEVVTVDPDALKSYYPQLIDEAGYVVLYEGQGSWADGNPRFKKLKEDEDVLLYWYVK